MDSGNSLPLNAIVKESPKLLLAEATASKRPLQSPTGGPLVGRVVASPPCLGVVVLSTGGF